MQQAEYNCTRRRTVHTSVQAVPFPLAAAQAAQTRQPTYAKEASVCGPILSMHPADHGNTRGRFIAYDTVSGQTKWVVRHEFECLTPSAQRCSSFRFHARGVHLMLGLTEEGKPVRSIFARNRISRQHEQDSRA
jgi:hypothetical protein